MNSFLFIRKTGVYEFFNPPRAESTCEVKLIPKFGAMRRILSILLVLTILMQSLSQLIVWAGYEINLNYISKELCVNKEVKNSCCHGKCYLKKEMQQTESREQSSSVKEKNEVISGVVSNPLQLIVYQQQEIEPVILNEPFIISGYRSSVFHPPSIA